jgi:hypothetical protein
VLLLVFFVWPCKPYRTVTSRREHWPLLIRVSCITGRFSLSFIRFTEAGVGAGVVVVGGGGGRETVNRKNKSYHLWRI